MPQEAPNTESGVWAKGKPLCPLGGDTLEAIGRSLNLTGREQQIIQGLFDGKREDAIAGELGISRWTVHAHLGRVYKKLEVDCCTGLLLRVFREYVALEPRTPQSAISAASDPCPSLRLGGTF